MNLVSSAQCRKQRDGDGEHTCRDDDSAHESRGALSGGPQTLERDRGCNDSHRTHIHDADYQQDCNQAGTARPDRQRLAPHARSPAAASARRPRRSRAGRRRLRSASTRRSTRGRPVWSVGRVAHRRSRLPSDDSATAKLFLRLQQIQARRAPFLTCADPVFRHGCLLASSRQRIARDRHLFPNGSHDGPALLAKHWLSVLQRRLTSSRLDVAQWSNDADGAGG